MSLLVMGTISFAQNTAPQSPTKRATPVTNNAKTEQSKSVPAGQQKKGDTKGLPATQIKKGGTPAGATKKEGGTENR